MAMKRVALLKSLTLLQLELMAALVGARLSSHILETLPTLNMTFWSDSQNVLHWLTTTKAPKRFVLSRVEEIKQLTSRLPWRYCPTDDNPADLLTRGISAQAYLGNQLWDAGSAWLPNREKWPTWEFSQSTLQMSPEYADDKPTQTTTVSSLECSEVPGIHRVINATDYSTYPKLH